MDESVPPPQTTTDSSSVASSSSGTELLAPSIVFGEPSESLTETTTSTSAASSTTESDPLSSSFTTPSFSSAPSSTLLTSSTSTPPTSSDSTSEPSSTATATSSDTTSTQPSPPSSSSSPQRVKITPPPSSTVIQQSSTPSWNLSGSTTNDIATTSSSPVVTNLSLDSNNASRVRTPLLASLVPIAGIILMGFAGCFFYRRRQNKRFDVIEGIVSQRREARQRARLLDGEDFVPRMSERSSRGDGGGPWTSEGSYKDKDQDLEPGSSSHDHFSGPPVLPPLSTATALLPAGARPPESPGLVGQDYYTPFPTRHASRSQSRVSASVSGSSSSGAGMHSVDTTFSSSGAGPSIQTVLPSYPRYGTTTSLARYSGPTNNNNTQSTPHLPSSLSHIRSRSGSVTPTGTRTPPRPFLPSRTSDTGSVFHEHTSPPPTTSWIDPVLRCGSEVDLSGIVDGVMGAGSSSSYSIPNEGRGRSNATNEALIDLDVDVVEDNARNDSEPLPPPGLSSASGWGRQRSSSPALTMTPPARSWSGLMLTVANPSPASPATIRGANRSLPSVDLTLDEPQVPVVGDGRRRGSFSSLRDVPASPPVVWGSTFRSSPLAANVDLGSEGVMVDEERNGSFTSLRERPMSSSSNSHLTVQGREKRNWLERSPVGRRVESR